MKKKHLLAAARVLLGLPFLVFGLDHFLGFMEPPEPPTGAAGEFFTGLTAAGYLWPSVKALEVLAGLMLVGGQWVALALVLLAPVLFNIVAFHLALDRGQGLWIALVLAALWVVLAIDHRKQYRSLLVRTAQERHGG